MKVGDKKVCLKTLMGRIKTLKVNQILTSLFFLVGMMLAIFIMVSSTVSLFDSTIEHSYVWEIVTRFIFPANFILMTRKHFQKRKRMVEESVVQIVEVTLIPKMTIKC